MGLCLTVMCAAELPIFFFIGRLLSWLGVNIALHMVLGVYILRLVLYYLLPWAGTPWAVLPVSPYFLKGCKLITP